MTLIPQNFSVMVVVICFLATTARGSGLKMENNRSFTSLLLLHFKQTESYTNTTARINFLVEDKDFDFDRRNSDRRLLDVVITLHGIRIAVHEATWKCSDKHLLIVLTVYLHCPYSPVQPCTGMYNCK
jgi:hypothetical protein